MLRPIVMTSILVFAVGSLVWIGFFAAATSSVIGDLSQSSELVARIGPFYLDPDASAVAPLSHEFCFSNPSSTSPMRLSLTNRSCGCTSAKVVTDPVPPRGIGRVVVQVNVDMVSRIHRESVTFTTGLESPKTMTLTLEGEIYQRLAAEFLAPSPVPVTRGESSPCEFQLVACHPSTEPLQIFQATLEPNNTGITLSTPQETVSNGTRRVSVRGSVMLDTPASGSNAPGFQIDSQYGKVRSRISIPVRLRKAVVSSPDTLFVHSRRGLPETRTTFEIRADSPVLITDIKVSSDTLRVEGAGDLPAKLHQLVLIKQSQQTSGRAERHWIRVQTDHPRQPELTVPIFILNAQ